MSMIHEIQKFLKEVQIHLLTKDPDPSISTANKFQRIGVAEKLTPTPSFPLELSLELVVVIITVEIIKGLLFCEFRNIINEQFIRIQNIDDIL